MKDRMQAGTMTAALVVLAALVALPASAGAQRTLYVGNQNSPDVSTFAIGAGGGLSLVGAPIAALSDAWGLAVSPGGDHLYAGTLRGVAPNSGRYGVRSFGIGGGGVLTEIAAPTADGAEPPIVATHPGGKHLFAAFRSNFPGNEGHFGVFAYEVAADGSAQPVSGSPFLITSTGGFNPWGLAVSPDGRHLYVSTTLGGGIFAFAIAADGFLTPLPQFRFGEGMNAVRGITISPNGRHLYAAELGSNAPDSPPIHAFSIDEHGALEELAGSPFATGRTGFSTDLAIAPDGGALYIAGTAGIVTAMEISPDGSIAPIGNFASGGSSTTTGIAVSPDGDHVYAANGSLSAVNAFAVAANGSLSQVPGQPFSTGGNSTAWQGLAIRPNQPPVAALSGPDQGVGDQPVGFDASGSHDPDGEVARYDWDYGDGTEALDAGPNPTHTYRSAGSYEVRVTLTDDEGCSTELVFSGRTAHCNGSGVATATHSIDVAASNVHRFAKLIHRPRNGTAAQRVRVPGAGRLVLHRNAKVRAFNRRVAGRGVFPVQIRPRAKVRRNMNRRARAGNRTRVRVRLRLTFNPDGGPPRTIVRQARLVRRP